MRQEPPQSSLWRKIWSLSIVVFVIGWYLTGSLTWGYESRWFNGRYLVHRFRDPHPSNNRISEEELRLYNGSDPSLPIYVAVDGMVFDVSSRPETYGSIGAYWFFSGRDAARAFATGCFKTDLTHDLRGLSDEELASVKSWQQFFLNNQKYWLIGYVDHPPLTGDPPEHCRRRTKPA